MRGPKETFRFGGRPAGLLASSAAFLVFAGSAAAAADTLRDALRATYDTSPSLNAQREALKGTDASVALAVSQARPQIAATVGLNRDLTRSGVLVTNRSKGPILSGGLDVNLPLFAGGRIRNSVDAAKARVEAGRAVLRAVEGDVFAEAVEAYMDVLRDRAILDLNRNQVRVLNENLRATTDLFQAGDLTRTDIAQSQARLSSASAQLALAQSRLGVSEEGYLRVIGRRPDQLASPPPLPSLPSTASEAARIAIARNPRLTNALQQARAAGLDVRVAFADRMPSLSGVLGGDYVNYVSDNPGIGVPRSGVQTSVGLTTRIPLYQGGAPAARVRQARAAEGQLLEQTVATERTVVATARSAFMSYQASLKAIASNQDAVSANELALRGTRAERQVGSRTVIEVLNAEQELLATQVDLIAARRDAYVAGFRLLQAMGQASSEDLNLGGGSLYDPLGNYREVAGAWSDWGGAEKHEPRSTPTLKLAEAAPEPVTAEPPQLASAGVSGASPQVQRVLATPIVPVRAAPEVRPASGRWAIQLGAFARAGAPQALFARLAARIGTKEPSYVPAGSVTRLLVGPYANREEAEAACRSLNAATPCLPVRRN
ncbi:TolC family outer membrane protein [Sphingomonas glaciei]|uniref:TolC family outer membrane protein n=1 Tax=Sphingomonas glaciei TaxID=2938948 RepID=A0ABY5MSR8_9SPHN|nr:TolC family outer membrane protein [Sphingomonas glaciei]UUR06974.1 TolC family outer membrane protein [Sphingomonas glaciei]